MVRAQLFIQNFPARMTTFFSECLQAHRVTETFFFCLVFWESTTGKSTGLTRAQRQ